MNSFERHKNPIKALDIGKRALYFKLSEGSIIKLVNNEDFDPTIETKPGDCLAIHYIDTTPRLDPEDEDGIEIHYHALDKEW